MYLSSLSIMVQIWIFALWIYSKKKLRKTKTPNWYKHYPLWISGYVHLFLPLFLYLVVHIIFDVLPASTLQCCFHRFDFFNFMLTGYLHHFYMCIKVFHHSFNLFWQPLSSLYSWSIQMFYLRYNHHLMMILCHHILN